jgi:hypothetical protein
MDPDWGASIDRTDRRIKLREKVAEIPLSKFRVKDLPLLTRINNCEGLWTEHKERIKELGIDG